jgi:predicted nucleic acid-binding protein
LVSGESFQSLDDGEASAIAFALSAGGAVAVDEKKARRISSERFPSLPVFRSVELLFHKSICDAFGLMMQADLVFRAISDGRMQVGADFVGRVITLIGRQRAAQCKSLGLR